MSFRLSKLLNALRIEGSLKACWDLRQRSLLDQSGNGYTLSVIGANLTWKRGPKGEQVYTPRSGVSYLSPGNPAGLQLSTCTVFCVAGRNEGGGVLFQGIIAKASACGVYYIPGAEPLAYGTFDFGGMATRTSSFTATNDFVPRMYAASFQSGVALGSVFYVNGAPYGTFTLTVASQASPWGLGFNIGDSNGLGGGVLLAGIVNRVLTPAEHASLYSDWMAEGWVGDSPRVIRYSYPSKRASEYAAAGIVLDTSVDRGSDGKIVDYVGNYPGTLGGVPTPASEGGTVFNGANDYDTHGDVTQLNGVSAFSLEMKIALPSANIPASYLARKVSGATTQVALRIATAAAATQPLYLYVSNGLDSYVFTTSPVLRAKCSQHVLATFNAGTGRIFADGESYPLTAGPNALPATTANLAGNNLFAGYTAASTPSTYQQVRVFNRALTPDQLRAEYLQWAKRVDWMASGESTPVSLVASVGVGKYIGDWLVQSGSAKVSETSDGRRWIECLGTTSTLVTPSSNAFGTWTFTVIKAASAFRVALSFIASQPVAFNVAPQNAYSLRVETGGDLLINRTDNGASVATPMITAAGYTVAGTAYTYCIDRRPSDGRFTMWIKGGIYTSWTLVSTAGGGSGSNPSGTDATWSTSAWIALMFGVGDKILIHDPNTPGQYPTHWQGQLIPTLGELPDTFLLNILRWSEQFDNALWTKSNLTVTPNAAASPFGAPNQADLITATAGGATALLYQTKTGLNPGAQYTYSAYAKPSVGTDFYLILNDTVTGQSLARFNSVTGALVSTTAGVYGNMSAGSEPIGGGWYRYWISGSQPAGQTNMLAAVVPFNNGDALYPWGAQLVQGPCAGSYRETQ